VAKRKGAFLVGGGLSPYPAPTQVKDFKEILSSAGTLLKNILDRGDFIRTDDINMTVLKTTK
jgi:hypothetical protein